MLGAMLMDEDALALGVAELDADDFTVGRYRIAFETMADAHRRGDSIDPPVLAEEVAAGRKMAHAEAVDLVAELLDATPTAANIAHHARVVRDRTIRRRLLKAAEGIIGEIEAGETADLAVLVDRAEQRVFRAADGQLADGSLEPVKKLVYPAIQVIESGGPKGLPTGYVDLDSKLTGGGVLPGQLIIVAGRPGMGKSVAGLQMALHASIWKGTPTAFFSLEMMKTELVLRALAVEADTDLQAMCQGEVPDAVLPRLMDASARLHNAPLWIDDTPGQSVIQIRSKCRRMKSQGGLGLVVVDYLQYVVAEAENRVQQIGIITRGLKQLGKELAVPVVALCQLSRAPEQRSNHRPQLSDLRESGDIEQDADVVLLLYRQEYYDGPKDSKGEDIEGRAEMIIGKQRNGPTTSIDLYFRKESVRFEAADWRTN